MAIFQFLIVAVVVISWHSGIRPKVIKPEAYLRVPPELVYKHERKDNPFSFSTPLIMASRNRPRGAFVKEDASDAHEERNMWSQIVTDIKRLRATHARAAEVARLQVDLEVKMGKCKDCGWF